MKWRQGLFVFCLIWLVTDPVFAEPQIQVRLQPFAKVKVGEACHLVLEVSWKTVEAEYRFPVPEIFLEQLALEELGESNEIFRKEGEEWRKKTFRYGLRALKPGKGRIQAFRLSYVDPVRSLGGHFEIPAREIKIVPDRSGFYWIASWTAVIVGTIALTAGCFLRQRSRRSGAVPASESRLEDRYVSQIQALRGKATATGATREKILEVGKLFRAYLSEKHSLTSGILTSRETVAKLEGHLPSGELKSLKIIFDKLDEGRYSSSAQSLGEWPQLFDELIHYIEGKRIVSV